MGGGGGYGPMGGGGAGTGQSYVGYGGGSGAPGMRPGMPGKVPSFYLILVESSDAVHVGQARWFNSSSALHEPVSSVTEPKSDP